MGVQCNNRQRNEVWQEKHLWKIDVLGNRKLTLFIRVAVGLTFLVFGALKLSDPRGFVDSVLSYNIIPDWLARAYGWVLPPIEVIIGLLFIIGFRLRLVALATILITISFIVATTHNLYWGKTSIITCGCLGKIKWHLNTGHLVLQVIMLVMLIQVLFHRGELLSLNSRRLRKDRVGS
jgi:uncharacterized membrane protein YphA (DoxX/SURF4 family)